MEAINPDAVEFVTLPERLAAVAGEGDRIVARVRTGEYSVMQGVAAFEDWRRQAEVVLREVPPYLHEPFAAMQSPCGTTPMADVSLTFPDAHHLSLQMENHANQMRQAADIQAVREGDSPSGRRATTLLVQDALLDLHHRGQRVWVDVQIPSDDSDQTAQLLSQVDAWHTRVEWLVRTALPADEARLVLEPENAPPQNLEIHREGFPIDTWWLLHHRHVTLIMLARRLHSDEWSVSPSLTADQLAP